MNKVKGPLAKKPMGSAKRNQGGKRTWSNKLAPGALQTAGSAPELTRPKPRTKKVRHGL